MFEAIRLGFLEGRKPFIGLDDYYLKGLYRVIFLYAIILDGNRGVISLAFVIVEFERGIVGDGSCKC